MSIQKMRDEFEAACLKHAEDAGFDESGPVFVRSAEDSGCYADSHTQAAWWAWQASREMVVIDLPPRYGDDGFGGLSKRPDGYLLYADEVVAAAEATGAKVKS